MSLALREIWKGPASRWGLAWLLFTLLAGTLGPFGTFDILGPAERYGYWGLLAALGLGLEALRRALGGWQWRAKLRLASHLPYALVLASLILMINAALFGAAPSLRAFLFLCSVVLVVALCVEGVLYLTGRPPDAPGAAAARPGLSGDPAEQLLRKLPHSLRAPLIRLEAQDHYTLVVTETGQALVLIRFSDAMEMTGPDMGQRVHRSHWVAGGQVAAHRRRSGRDFLQMADGVEIPVSRSFRGAARDAGLIL